MPKLTFLESEAASPSLSAAERKQLTIWTQPLAGTFTKPRVEIDEETLMSVPTAYKQKRSMKEEVGLLYLHLRERSGPSPVKLPRYATAKLLGISPEALNSRLASLDHLGFLRFEFRDRKEFIILQSVPTAPRKYARRDFRGNNLHLNKFEGVLVCQLDAMDGTTFTPEIDSIPVYGKWNPHSRHPVKQLLEAMLAPFARSAKESDQAQRLYWNLLRHAALPGDVQEGDPLFALSSLYGRKWNWLRHWYELRRLFTVLQEARLIFAYYQARTIAVFPPSDRLPDNSPKEWEQACRRAIDRWLLSDGLANEVATLVAHYHATQKALGLRKRWEPKLWEAAKDLCFVRDPLGFTVEEVIELFVETCACGDDCTHEPHKLIQARVPATLAGLRDHLYFVCEQLLIWLGRVDEEGYILKFHHDTLALVRSGETLAALRASGEAWDSAIKSRRARTATRIEFAQSQGPAGP